MSTQDLIRRDILTAYGKFMCVTSITINLLASEEYQVIVNYCVCSHHNEKHPGRPREWDQAETTVANAITRYVGVPRKILNETLSDVPTEGYEIAMRTTATVQRC